MKRITAIAMAVLLTAFVTVNLASAQKRGGQTAATQADPKRPGKVLTEPPNENPDPKKIGGVLTGTPFSFDTSTHIAWDSGELQKQIGSKNKDKKKIVMRVWCEYAHVSPVNYWWQVNYTLKAENKDLTGPGWHEVNDLYAMSYSLTYNTVGNTPITLNGSKSLSGQSNVDGQIATGYTTIVLPTFTTNSFTGKRGGGSSGIDLDWP
jgi:hypothetical protein